MVRINQSAMKMKIYFTAFLLFFVCQTILAQNTLDSVKIDTDSVREFHEVSEMAKYPGGERAMYQFIGENLIYPPQAFENEIQGTVILQFIVNSDGSISNIEVISTKIGYGLEEASIKVVASMPNWEPAKFRGTSVPVRFRLPVKYLITGDDDKKKKGKNPALKDPKRYDNP